MSKGPMGVAKFRQQAGLKAQENQWGQLKLKTGGPDSGFYLLHPYTTS